MNNFRSNLTEWLRNNVDFALFLAVFTETPRWAVAFMAVNEPLWVGVPLGVLLAFATSHAWRAYFETKHHGLFAFNVASILVAVAVIAPVLFAMTSAPADQVNISDVLSDWWRGVWALLLALTTFIPLVQLAAIKGIDANNKAERIKARQVTKTVRATRTVEQSEQYTVVQPEQITEQPTDLTVWSDEQKRIYLAQLMNKGETPNKTKLARELGIGRTTLYAWIQELSAEVAS